MRWPIDWPERWRDKQAEFESPKLEWDEYRRNPVLMRGIQTGHRRWHEFRNRCIGLGVPLWLMEDDPDIGSPLGEYIDGTFTTPSSMRHATYAWRMYQNWTPPRDRVDVLEVGGGYGGFILALSRLFKIRAYYCADSDVMHRLRNHHLNQWFEKHDMYRFELIDLPPRPDEIEMRSVDLVMATNVLVEIPRDMLDKYIWLIEEKMVTGGLFYTENNLGKEVKSNADFGLDKHWKYLVNGEPYGVKGWGEIMAVRK